MIDLTVTNPTELWIALGREFFQTPWSKSKGRPIDIQLGDRRFVSIGNTFIISDWPKQWTGKVLFGLVGYSPKGYKMEVLRRTYVKEELWEQLKNSAKDESKGFSSKGMNFNMSLQKKGGCLSSLHLIRHRGRAILFVHGKIAEIPRKFIADLLLVRDLLQELSIWPMEVRFMYSVTYFSVVGLRSYIPVLGRKHMDFQGLPIDSPRNYQVGIIEAINRKKLELIDQFGKEKVREGIWDELDGETGDWKT